MPNSTTVAAPALNLRFMVPRDLPHLLHISQQNTERRKALKHFLKVFQSGEAAGWVAEKGNCIVGYVIYTVSPMAAKVRSRMVRVPSGKTVRADKPLCINLLNVAVASEWRRQGIARTMLEILDQKLWRTADLIKTLVPETNLPAQLFLRSAGYRAVRVAREAFEDEDGYVMERRR